MEFENHKDEVPFAHYAERFRNLDPQGALDRLRDVKWDGHDFFLKLLGREYAVSHPEASIRPTDGGKEPPRGRPAPPARGGPTHPQAPPKTPPQQKNKMKVLKINKK